MRLSSSCASAFGRRRSSLLISGQNLTVLDAVRQARRNGATVIAVTNRSASMLAQEADFTLLGTADDSPLTGETAAARVAQLRIVDALFVAVARINPAVTETNLGGQGTAGRPGERPGDA